MAARIAARGLPRGLKIALLVAGIGGLFIGVLAYVQVQRERRIDQEDLDRRAHALAHQMSWSARRALITDDAEVLERIGESLDGHRRVVGLGIYDAHGAPKLTAPAISEIAEELKPAIARALTAPSEVTENLRLRDLNLHVLAYPLRLSDGQLLGVLAVVHDISFIDQRATARLVLFGFWTILVSMLLVTIVVGATWNSYERPLANLAEWMRRVRTEDAVEAPPRGLPNALLSTESSRLAASFRAARSTGQLHSSEAVREHNAWTRDRLRDYAVDCLQGRQLIVVSNREPYMHQYRSGVPQMIVPAGGLVTALDPVLQAVGGLWVAHGAGDADRQTADAHGRLTVPPDNPRYTLRRVWLSREEEQGYYYGLSNEGLWPLCHLAHERPVFRAADWDHYERANRRFADHVLEEIGSSRATVLVQDYHLALVPAMLKEKRPDVQVGIFWHIPWPNPEAFRICPWRTEVLKGMLGADVIGFHLQQYCNNFLDTVDRMVEARLDWDHFSAELRGHRALVRPFPISIESWSERNVASGPDLDDQIRTLREQHKLSDTRVIVGVERVDYTKGIPERLRAFERFLQKHPEQREKVTFVILGAPSRTHLRRYRDLVADLESMADEINWRFQAENWKPIRLLIAHHDAATVHAFLSMADVCVVSPLHDGMNLVAKEYIAAKPPGEGVLVLSEFAGAARELSEALLINPYDTEQFADAIHYAINMPADERALRMEAMQAVVRENNVYRWAANLLTTLAATSARGFRPTTTRDAAMV